MKKIIINFILMFFLVSCVQSKNIKVYENYESMIFEISVNEKKIMELPFSIYSGYEYFNDTYYFIDCTKSQVSGYGELCYFDSSLCKIKYLDVYTGESFFIQNELLVTSNPIKQDRQNDIDNVFGINLNTKQYPLDIKIIDMKKWQILKEIDLSEYREDLNVESLYIKINEGSLNSIELNYGVYDTTKTYPIGQLNLTTFKIE